MTASSPNSDRNSHHRVDTGLSADHPLVPAIAHDLVRLVESGAKFTTIYADPPWPYSNTAARGAAVNHYPTMTLEAIRNEPLKTLAAQDAHLHFWTTNAFLHEALDDKPCRTQVFLRLSMPLFLLLVQLAKKLGTCCDTHSG